MRTAKSIRLALVFVACGSGCTGVPVDPDRLAAAVELAPADRPDTRRALAAGATIQLLPLSRSTPGATPKSYVIDGLWRVAMVQSTRFDCAGGVESCPSPFRIQLHLDATTYTTTLEEDGKPPIGLAAVQGADPGPALDRLAWLTRTALGEDLDMAPVPCRSVYSGADECLRFCESGQRKMHRGEQAAAMRLFEKARSYDGGSPTALLHLATTVASLGGDASAARSAAIANEALRFKNRLSPDVEHRLARVLVAAQRDDAKLLELGTRYLADRPHDPHAAYTVALAQNLEGEFKKSLPTLTRLRQRWPGFAWVRYQLCFALLATGDPETALEVIEEARRGLPRGAVVRPYAMALFHSGKHDELRRFLDALRRAAGIAGSDGEREVIRMQASHAILTGDREAAVRLLGEGMAFVRQRSSRLAQFAVDTAEDGEVLARLGATKTLRDTIDGFQQLGQLPDVFASAMTYLGGLVRVQSDEDPTRALTVLKQSNDSVWHSQLEAAIHHRRGELTAETAALERAASRSDSVLIKVNVARALEAAGESANARKISEHVHRSLLAFDQRQPYEHPLMTPGRALAFVASR